MCFFLLPFCLSFLGTWGGDGGGGIWLWVILADQMDRRSIVGQMQNPTYGFGDKSGGGDDDHASLKSGWSGETLGVESSGERRGSLMKRLFRRNRGEEKGGEEKGKNDDEGS